MVRTYNCNSMNRGKLLKGQALAGYHHHCSCNRHPIPIAGNSKVGGVPPSFVMIFWALHCFCESVLDNVNSKWYAFVVCMCVASTVWMHNKQVCRISQVPALSTKGKRGKSPRMMMGKGKRSESQGKRKSPKGWRRGNRTEKVIRHLIRKTKRAMSDGFPAVRWREKLLQYTT